MRRHAVRLVLAIAATTMLAACADMPTAPKAPTANATPCNQTQGSQTC